MCQTDCDISSELHAAVVTAFSPEGLVVDRNVVIQGLNDICLDSERIQEGLRVLARRGTSGPHLPINQSPTLGSVGGSLLLPEDVGSPVVV